MRSLRASKVVSVPHAVAGISSWSSAGWARRARSPTLMTSSIQPSGDYGDFLGHGVLLVPPFSTWSAGYAQCKLCSSLEIYSAVLGYGVDVLIVVQSLLGYGPYSAFPWRCRICSLSTAVDTSVVHCRSVVGGMHVQVQFLNKVYMPVVLQRQVYWPR